MNTLDPYEPRKGEDLYQEVAEKIILPEQCPYFVYGLGIARNGTTSSLNFMSQAGLEDNDGSAYQVQCGYQHFKAGYRQAMHNWPKTDGQNLWKFEIPDARSFPLFYTKDPLGPYTHTESVFNPFILLDLIDYPKDKLFIIFFFRDPKEVLASWIRNWGHVRDRKTLRENFVTASHYLRTLHEEAIAKKYPHAFYIYEALRDHSPVLVIEKLFEQINKSLQLVTGLHLIVTEHTALNWDTEKIKNIWSPDEPVIYNRKEISELHQSAKTSSGLKYKKYTEEELLMYLTQEDLDFLAASTAYEDYEYFRNQYVISTGLDIKL